MKNSFSLDEIPDWASFEDLASEYFRVRGHYVEPTGKGQDGGIDLLVTIKNLTDGLAPYERKWVVQCKFYDRTLTLPELATVNIPSLIHSKGADGYLLICRKDVWSTITNMFDDFRRDCRFQYNYEIWTGSRFESELNDLPAGPIFQKYFPEYQEYLMDRAARAAKI